MFKRIFLLALLVASLSIAGFAGERAFSWTQAPAKGDYVGVRFNPYNLGKYLAQCQVNRPEIVGEVHEELAKGGYYRKSTKDQKGTGVKLTVSVNPDYMLRIVTWRDETCETCNGTGKKELPFGKFTKNINTAIKCQDCKGKGFHPNHTTEKYFIISAEDFEDPKEGRRVMSDRSFSDAPRGAENWVERLVSRNPRERLDACVWLDENYVQVGNEFQSIMPMLKKARYHETNEKKKTMVWQFWAGKDMNDERNRAFYRIYANSKTGKITQKGFYAAN